MYDSFAINVAAHFLVYGGKYEAQASKMKPSHLLHTLLSGLCFAIHNLILKKIPSKNGTWTAPVLLSLFRISAKKSPGSWAFGPSPGVFLSATEYASAYRIP